VLKLWVVPFTARGVEFLSNALEVTVGMDDDSVVGSEGGVPEVEHLLAAFPCYRVEFAAEVFADFLNDGEHLLIKPALDLLMGESVAIFTDTRLGFGVRRLPSIYYFMK
jgi:hypothetical protein